ncbi:MAG TPA: hypothetical protein VES67_19580 [Vicinamibacterales bacterium]|nr:hypothetical protein [Vicinamibacterales bacterium]
MAQMAARVSLKGSEQDHRAKTPASPWQRESCSFPGPGREDLPGILSAPECNACRFQSKWNAKWNSVAISADKIENLLRKFANRGLAERVGVPDCGFAKANGINGFAIISRNRNDLATSNLRSVFVRSPTFVDFSISMALDMALDGVFLQALRHDNRR